MNRGKRHAARPRRVPARGVRFLAGRPFGPVALRRRETELSLERPVGPDGPAGGVVRLTVRFDADGGAAPPSPNELAEALDGLKADLEALVGRPLAALPAQRADRELAELVEAYHPRQRALVDLLHEEGELTDAEHGRLAEYLAGTPPPVPKSWPSPAAEPPARFDQPISAVPIAAERSGDAPRSVAALIREFQIASLKQAGAVRARRQISFEEYMALKRHFQPADGPAPGA